MKEEANREKKNITYKSGLKITDSRSPVMMTGQMFFSPDKPRFWPVKINNNEYYFFLPKEYRIMLAIDRYYYIE